MVQVKKVIAYITRGQELLVFEHRDFPDAGVQVPAGTVDPVESLESAALREVEEESGLKFAGPEKFLGCFEWFRRETNEIHLRHVFHFQSAERLPETWSHTVSGGELDRGLVFNYFWLPIDQAKTLLSGDQGAYLHLIRP